ncbi:hypothetical protein GQR58_014453 [Nymphon striatum]|nr:hypothetical protein GQR58_014453 [Nymphon striatum]
MVEASIDSSDEDIFQNYAGKNGIKPYRFEPKRRRLNVDQHGNIACLKFINTLLDKTMKASYRVQLQSELNEAGFKLQNIEEKLCLRDLDGCREVLDEIDRWHTNFIDVDSLLKKYKELELHSSQLQTELIQKCEEKENELQELRKKLANIEVERIEESTISSPQETDDSGWRSTCSHEYEVPEEMTSPGSEEVTISAPVLLKPDPEKEDEIEEKTAAKPEYYLFNDRSEMTAITAITARSSTSTTKAKYQSSQDTFASDINRKILEDDFDSALSETDSDSKPSTWRYPSIPSPIFRRKEPPRTSRTNMRLYKPSERSFYGCRAKSEEALMAPLMKKHPAAHAESPSSVFQKLDSNSMDMKRRSFMSKPPSSSRTFRIYPSDKRISASLIEISPLPVPIPTPDYPTETTEEDNASSSSLSIFRKTSVKFRKAFSERKKKQKPNVWEVI